MTATQSTADQVLAAMQPLGLKLQRNGCYRANSPFRPGSNSSAFCLRIDGPEFGAYFDHAGGDQGSLYDLAKHLGVSLPRRSSAAPTETSYDYTDATGKVLYQVVRIQQPGKSKTFRQRQPDGRGGWVWSLTSPPVERVLYRLSDVLAAVQANELVFVVEGERDVDTLRLHGLAATTNPGGAGKWRPEYNAVLAGATVYILPDNDTIGEQHAQQVCAALQGVAASVKIIKLPGLLPKGDISDWLATGNTVAQLQALCNAATQPAAPATPATPPSSTPQKLSEEIADVLTRLGHSFRLNLCDDSIEVNGIPLDDTLHAKIRMECRDLRVRPLTAVDDVIVTLAAANAYHPVKDYLTALQWDGVSRINDLAEKLSSDDAPIDYGQHECHTHAIYLLRWLIGAVAKALAGEQNLMLVLAGPQGIGKSGFVRWLCSGLPDRFVEGPINPDDKDTAVRLMTQFVWEVGELDGTTRRADVAALKGFLTKQKVTLRKAYAHHDISKPALCSFIGTVNNGAGFLADESGSRRFLVTSITGIDWSYTALAINQIWAEAVHLYHQGESWRLSPVELAHQAQQNQAYEVESPLEDWIGKHFIITPNGTERMNAGDIISHLRNNDIRLSGTERSQGMELSRILERLGVAKIRTNAWRGYQGISIK